MHQENCAIAGHNLSKPDLASQATCYRSDYTHARNPGRQTIRLLLVSRATWRSFTVTRHAIVGTGSARVGFCIVCFQGGSGVNGFVKPFAELRSFAAKNLPAVENNRELNPSRVRARELRAVPFRTPCYRW